MPIKISIVGSTVLANAPIFSKGKIVIQPADRFALGEEAVRCIPNRNIDVALVNYELPCMDGFECARKLKAALPNLPILMFTNGMPTHSRDEDFVFPALHAGANGYLPGDLPPTEILDVINQIHNSVRRNRPVFLMFFESNRQLSCSAKHWEKITAMLNASTVTVSYGKDWRKVVVPFKRAIKKSSIQSFVPLVTIRDKAFAAI